MAKAITRPKSRPVRPEELGQAAAAAWPVSESDHLRSTRRRGLQRLLTHLAAFPGQTWQQRWEASGLNERGRPVRDLAGGEGRRAELTRGLEALLCLRVIQPELVAFRSNHFVHYDKAFRAVQADERLDAFLDAVTVAEASPLWKRRAAFDVCCALTTQGIAFADLTPESFLHYACSTKDAGMAAYSYGVYVGHLAWEILRSIGQFPPATPTTLRAALRAPQLTPAELVGQYDVADPEVRQLLVDYLERRSHDMDYGSLSALATTLGTANIRVRDEQTGRDINVTAAEDTAFWQWAIIETLRHTGVRIEELLELSQLSIRQYQRPNGEVIALLVIAPSKTDRERVIPMSAELFHVVACILRRLTSGRPTVPLATRYDAIERITSQPQPFLFQRRLGQSTEVMSNGVVREMLRRLFRRLAEDNPRFAEAAFTPHDFRRLFATDLVNHGLPIHIGAALLGHLNLETTRGYVAVFDEDVIRHYQGHLARRRAMRPTHEYRAVTDTEWGEFEEHFDKRKLELGSCGRPYATPCSHEHACIRCPMLNLDPKMLGRLEEIEADLLARKARAEVEGWIGEIEGVDLTLTFLHSKREEAVRLSRIPAIDLGMPRKRGCRE